MSTANLQCPSCGKIGSVTTAAAIRADARQRLRDALLDAAAATAADTGWSSVRIGAVAQQVGVSRQTVHNEFGTKAALGQALVQREADMLLARALEVMQMRADDPAAAVSQAATDALVGLGEHPLLLSIIAGPADDALLPLLTSRAGPQVERATAAVTAWVLGQAPDAEARQTSAAVDAVVRLVISHAVMPSESPEIVGPRLGRIFAVELAAARGGDQR